MELDELPAQGQAEPGPLRFLIGVADLAELFEHGLMVLGRDPDARVADGEMVLGS